jgi:hypothetical protein
MPHHMMNQMSSMAGPLTRRSGMTAGAGMEEGMGMPRGGNATAEEYGPSLGRGMGASSSLAQPTTNGPLSPQHAEHPTSGMPMQMQMGNADVSKDANSVPGFPQDAFMESPMMAMDAMVAKPETFGLRPGWSGYMQGMMTLIRVLPPDQYDHIVSLRAKQAEASPAAMPNMPEQHEK